MCLRRSDGTKHFRDLSPLLVRVNNEKTCLSQLASAMHAIHCFFFLHPTTIIAQHCMLFFSLPLPLFPFVSFYLFIYLSFHVKHSSFVFHFIPLLNSPKTWMVSPVLDKISHTKKNGPRCILIIINNYYICF